MYKTNPTAVETFSYEVTLPRDYNPGWHCLTDISVKGAIIHELSNMFGYGTNYPKFVNDFRGLGKVTITASEVSLFFSDLKALGINTDSSASPADVDHMLREKMIILANPQTDDERFAAKNRIIGTVVNGFDTNPRHHRS